MTTNKEKLGNLKRWMLRLLRKETPQAVAALRTNNNGRFCCLGDLIDSCLDPSNPDLKEEPNVSAPGSLTGYSYKGDYNDTFLPKGFVRDFLEPNPSHVINLNNLNTAGKDYYFTPSRMNDRRISKQTIAILIWALIPLGQEGYQDTNLKNEVLFLFKDFSLEDLSNDEWAALFTPFLSRTIEDVGKIND